RLRLLREPLLHEVAQRGHGAEVVARGALVLHANAEFALEHDHDLERVDGVEAEAAGKERHVVPDVVRRHIFEFQAVDQELLQFPFEVHVPQAFSHFCYSRERTSMLDRFLELTDASPDAVALIDAATGRTTTRAQLLARSREIVRQFAAAGLREGDAVAMQLPNSVNFVATFMAVLEQKLVALLIDRDAPESEVARILGHFAVRALAWRSNGDVNLSVRGAGAKPALPPAARLIKLTSGS